jgi:hypothetical protein
MGEKKWEPRMPTRERPLETAAAKKIYERQAEIVTERERCHAVIKATEAEIKRLEESIATAEAEQAAAAAAVMGDSELSAKGAVDKILTQKSGGLNQMRDSVGKLSTAVIEAGKQLRKLRAEEDRLGKDLVVLEQLKKFENAAKHFKSFVSSWEDAERDHAEFVRLLTELRDVGVDAKRMLKAAGVADDSLFGAVASSTFIFNRHTLPDFALEMGSKRAILENPFYHGETARVKQGKADFLKGHVFNGCFFQK